MKFIANIFWNENERRVRALWRLVLQIVLLFLVMLVLKYAILLIVALVGLATQRVMLEQMNYNEVKALFLQFSENHYDVPLLAQEFVSTLASVWLAGRIFDRRRFANFGFRLNKNWWTDFGFGLFLGGFLISLVFVIELAAGWVTITGTFVTDNPDNVFVIALLYPVAAMLMVGIQEELTFRGYQLTNLAEGLNWKPLGPRGAVASAMLLSAVTFALLHANNPHASAVSTFSAFMGGIIAALGFTLTGELAIPIGLHITWNFFQANVFGFTLSGMEFSWATLFTTEQSGPALWVGDAFGPESGLLTIGAVVLGCLLILLWVRLRYGRIGLRASIATVNMEETFVMRKSQRIFIIALIIFLSIFWLGSSGCTTPPPTATETPQVEEQITSEPTATGAPQAEEQITSEPTAVSETAPPETTTPLLDIPWDDRSIFRTGLIASEQNALDGLAGASVYHIDFQIADDLLSLAGWEEVHYTNQETESLNEIYFQFFPNAAGGSVAVSGVTVDGQEVETAYEFEDTALQVTLPEALQPGAFMDIRLEFEVNIPQEMAGNYGLFGYFDEVLVLDEFYPVIPVYDDEGWNVQAPPPNADTSYFDISFYLVRITAPVNLTVAASGIEVSRKSEGSQQILTFAAGPMRDFYLAASEHYTVVSETVGETVINSYALNGMEEGARTALQFSKDALNSLGERFGPYPYTEFDMLSTPMLALGIEYPGIVGIVLSAFDPEETVSGLPFPIMLESVVAHEAAHQWFYNVIGNDQIDEPWLDEAHAQYATWLYYVDVYGEANAQGYRSSWDGRWQRVEEAEIPIGLPAYAYEGSEYSAIVYGRGPIFVETLAKEMGRETFDQFLRDYYQTHQWEIATTESYRQLAEEHCGCDLSALFAAWVYP